MDDSIDAAPAVGTATAGVGPAVLCGILPSDPCDPHWLHEFKAGRQGPR
ncbi:MAG: hypothetical protein NZ578_03335 [Candidatus Binatia bacterium]|nr:hypothetical protein [Candidatus Binatia bacterium]